MTAPSILADLIDAGELIPAHQPWPRAWVDADIWQQAIRHLAEGTLTLLSLWAEPGYVHMALLARELAVDSDPTEAAILDPAAPPATEPEPTDPEPTGLEPFALEPTITQPATAEPTTVAQPTTTEPTPDAPIIANPAAASETPTVAPPAVPPLTDPPPATTPTDTTPSGPTPSGPTPSGPTPSGPTPSGPTRATIASIAVLSIECPGNRYPSVGASHPPAIRLERAIRDLFGLQPDGLTDIRPWLDHGRWSDEQALATTYPFLPVHGEGLHQIPVGPVHAGIIEPGHFRFTCDGETVVRLEQRLGYVHKGIDLLMSGAPLARAARLAGRVSGDSTVAYALAFARAVEAALGIEPPPRAVWLRAIMAELERIANHIGDFGAICNDASLSIMLAHCAVLREQILRTCAACFGHRLMMDRIVPGGVAVVIDPGQIAQLQALTKQLRAAMPHLIHLYDDTPSLQDRTVTTGFLPPELASRFGAGGFVGRASGRNFDARRDLPYAPYDELTFTVPVRQDGDVNARVWIRIKEIEASLSLLDQLLADLPDGPVIVEVNDEGGEGIAIAEAFRGDVLVWVRIANGIIERCHLRDASWFQWPLLEAVIEGNIVADFPLCNKSFNCSYSGHDL